ncbi:hypothetical protein D3C85_1162300 [compost metagenome]
MGSGDANVGVVGANHEGSFDVPLHIEIGLAVGQQYAAAVAIAEVEDGRASIQIHLAPVRQQHLAARILSHVVANTARQRAHRPTQAPEAPTRQHDQRGTRQKSAATTPPAYRRGELNRAGRQLLADLPDPAHRRVLLHMGRIGVAPASECLALSFGALIGMHANAPVGGDFAQGIRR